MGKRRGSNSKKLNKRLKSYGVPDRHLNKEYTYTGTDQEIGYKGEKFKVTSVNKRLRNKILYKLHSSELGSFAYIEEEKFNGYFICTQTV